MIDEQIGRLEQGVAGVERAVAALDEDVFLGELGRWTPRDIVAHLIGWNLSVIEGSQQIQRGELPFYDVEPGENYANVNAALVREHVSTNRVELLNELRDSAEELASFLRSLDTSSWENDYGVRHGDEVLTIRGTVDDLIADYEHHRRQLESV